ncbi:MAG: hypothetical protein RI894_1297 [Bacteroidota bacterium]
MDNLLFNKKFNGKLLLTAEYVVLDGAEAIALPTTKFGQYLQVRTEHTLCKGQLKWNSLDADRNSWFAAKFDSSTDFEILDYSTNSMEIAATLRKLLQTARQLNPSFLQDTKIGVSAQTQIDYPRLWGLGSSSTLVAAVASWANIDGFELNRRVFSGSGYDIACAENNQPFLFVLQNKIAATKPTALPIILPTISPNILPNFALTNLIYFIYLDKKQNSREGIAHYKQLSEDKRATLVPQISKISRKISANSPRITYTEFNDLLDEHEEILAKALKLDKVKNTHFADYWGTVKSLGAWGGDFVLATSHRSKEETFAYFFQKGFKTVLTWHEMF